MSGSTVLRAIALAKLAASARHIAGGHSLRLVVCQRPKVSLPIEAACGKSSHTLPCLICLARSGRWRAKMEVGLGDLAPKSPWAKSILSKPGRRLSSSAISVRQIEAEVGVAGGAGCSKAPTAPVACRRTIIRNEKRSSWLPTNTWSTSRTAKHCIPQSSASVRSTRGPCAQWSAAASGPWSSECSRALLQVSHGGPAR